MSIVEGHRRAPKSPDAVDTLARLHTLSLRAEFWHAASRVQERAEAEGVDLRDMAGDWAAREVTSMPEAERWEALALLRARVDPDLSDAEASRLGIARHELNLEDPGERAQVWRQIDELSRLFEADLQRRVAARPWIYRTPQQVLEERRVRQAQRGSSAPNAHAVVIAEGSTAPDDEVGEKGPQDELALNQVEARVLRTMARFSGDLLSCEAIAAATRADEQRQIGLDPKLHSVGERTVRDVVKKFIGLGLAERPGGRNGGARLTMAGRRRAAPKIAG